MRYRCRNSLPSKLLAISGPLSFTFGIPIFFVDKAVGRYVIQLSWRYRDPYMNMGPWAALLVTAIVVTGLALWFTPRIRAVLGAYKRQGLIGAEIALKSRYEMVSFTLLLRRGDFYSRILGQVVQMLSQGGGFERDQASATLRALIVQDDIVMASLESGVFSDDAETIHLFAKRHYQRRLEAAASAPPEGEGTKESFAAGDTAPDVQRPPLAGSDSAHLVMGVVTVIDWERDLPTTSDPGDVLMNFVDVMGLEGEGTHLYLFYSPVAGRDSEDGARSAWNRVLAVQPHVAADVIASEAAP